jgi:hypothetical protein
MKRRHNRNCGESGIGMDAPQPADLRHPRENENGIHSLRNPVMLRSIEDNRRSTHSLKEEVPVEQSAVQSEMTTPSFQARAGRDNIPNREQKSKRRRSRDGGPGN